MVNKVESSNRIQIVILGYLFTLNQELAYSKQLNAIKIYPTISYKFSVRELYPIAFRIQKDHNGQ